MKTWKLYIRNMNIEISGVYGKMLTVLKNLLVIVFVRFAVILRMWR